MIKALTQWFGSSSTERAKLTDTELQPSQDYRMAQSFSGESVNPANGVSVLIPPFIIVVGRH